MSEAALTDDVAIERIASRQRQCFLPNLSLPQFLYQLLSLFFRAHILNCVHATRIRLRRLQLNARIESSYRASQYGSIDPAATGAKGANGLIINLPDGTPLPAGDEAGLPADPELEVIGYQQIASTVFGYYGRKFVDFILIFAQMGCGTAFLSLVLSNIVAVFRSHGIIVSLLAVGIGVFPIVLGLSIPRSTTYLAGASHLGNLSLLLAVSTIVFFAATSETSHFSFDTLNEIPAFVSLHGVMLFFGISAFSFTSHAEVISIEADAESREKYAKVLPVAMSSIVALYMSVSMFAAASFRQDTRSNVLLNLGDALLVNIVRIALSATLLVNYALAVFPASQALDLVLLGPAPVSELPHQREPGDLASASPSPVAYDEEQAPLVVSNGSVQVPKLSNNAAGLSRVSSANGLSFQAIFERNRRLSAYRWKGNIIRLGMVAFTFFIAITVVNLGLLFSVVGAVFGGTSVQHTNNHLCYTLPPLFWYRLCKLENFSLSIWRQAILISEVALGITLIAVGVTVAVQSNASTQPITH